MDHAWIPGSSDYPYCLCDCYHNNEIKVVAKLIDTTSKEWKRKLVCNTFSSNEAKRILQILLPREPHADLTI